MADNDVPDEFPKETLTGEPITWTVVRDWDSETGSIDSQEQEFIYRSWEGRTDSGQTLSMQEGKPNPNFESAV